MEAVQIVGKLVPSRPHPAAQDEIVGAGRGVELRLDVGGLEAIIDQDELAFVAVVIGLELEGARFAQLVPPAGKHILAMVAVAVEAARIGGEGVALNGEAVRLATPVAAEACLPALEAVVGIGGRTRGQVVSVEGVSVETDAAALAQLRAVAKPHRLLLRPRRRPHQPAQRIARVLAGDVDHAVHRIRAEQSAAGPADHLDLLQILQQWRVQFPEHPGVEGRIDAPPVDQHQQLVRALGAVEAAGGHRILPRVEPLDLEVGREPEHFGKRGRRGAGDVVLGDDEDRGRRPADRLGLLGGRADLDLGQLLDREGGELLDALRLGRACQNRLVRHESRCRCGQQKGAPPSPTDRSVLHDLPTVPHLSCGARQRSRNQVISGATRPKSLPGHWQPATASRSRRRHSGEAGRGRPCPACRPACGDSRNSGCRPG